MQAGGQSRALRDVMSSSGMDGPPQGKPAIFGRPVNHLGERRIAARTPGPEICVRLVSAHRVSLRFSGIAHGRVAIVRPSHPSWFASQRSCACGTRPSHAMWAQTALHCGSARSSSQAATAMTVSKDRSTECRSALTLRLWHHRRPLGQARRTLRHSPSPHAGSNRRRSVPTRRAHPVRLSGSAAASCGAGRTRRR